jgi:uncharacterized protein
MTGDLLIKASEDLLKSLLAKAEAGHNWFHIERVRTLALRIQKNEGGNVLVLELAALWHDVDDAKFNGGNEQAGGQATLQHLVALGADTNLAQQVAHLVQNCSYKGGEGLGEASLELQILRDADRLDAIGAIGIARTFQYGGFKNQAIYDPKIAVRDTMSVSEYRQEKSSTINHFYEKLLKLKDGMYTSTAKKIAQERHAFMIAYLDQFFQEWEGQ